MTDKEKIRQEIERLMNELIQEKEKGFGSDIDDACILELQNVLTFIDSLQEEPISKDLDEELDKVVYQGKVYTRIYRDKLDQFANRYPKKVPRPEKKFAKYSETDMVIAVKAGAQWQKEWMIDKACEWLEDNVFSSEQLDRNYSDKFRKAMEG